MCSLITTTNRNHVLLPPLGLLIFYFSCLVLGDDKLLRFLRRQGSSRQIKQTPIVEIYIFFFIILVMTDWCFHGSRIKQLVMQVFISKSSHGVQWERSWIRYKIIAKPETQTFKGSWFSKNAPIFPHFIYMQGIFYIKMHQTPNTAFYIKYCSFLFEIQFAALHVK